MTAQMGGEMKIYVYYVVYMFQGENGIGFGNIEVGLKKKPTDLEMIKEIATCIESEAKLIKAMILNYKLLRTLRRADKCLT